MKTKKESNRNPRLIIFLVFLIAFTISILSIITRFYRQYSEDATFKELASNTLSTNEYAEPSSVNVSSESCQNTVSDNNKILPEYETLYQENSDLYGWLKIDNTVIDYPVMYSPNDPQLYLYKNFYKKDSASGTPFILVPSATNTIVYGHNMKNKSMFSSLLKYKDTDFWANHRYIEFNTLTDKGTYEVFIVANAVVYYDESQVPEGKYLFYKHTDLSSEKEFEKYILNLTSNSYFETNVTAKYGDSLLTLVTCDYVQDNARIVIVAKKCSPKN